jgi:hypothetical protein
MSSVTVSRGKKFPPINSRPLVGGGLITERPQTPKDLARLHGVSVEQVLEAMMHANLQVVGRDVNNQPLFDPRQVSKALIRAGHYPTIRGA